MESTVQDIRLKRLGSWNVKEGRVKPLNSLSIERHVLQGNTASLNSIIKKPRTLSILERERLILWLKQQTLINKDVHWFAAILQNHLKTLNPFRIVSFWPILTLNNNISRTICSSTHFITGDVCEYG